MNNVAIHRNSPDQLLLDAQEGALFHGPQILRLTWREARLVECLIRRSGAFVGVPELAEFIFADDLSALKAPEGAIRAIVCRLKIRMVGVGLSLQNGHNKGYRLTVSDGTVARGQLIYGSFQAIHKKAS